MAIQSFQLDPNAQAYTDNQIVEKIDNATVDITRAGSVDAAARPIEAGEVGATELADEAYTSTEKTKLGTVEDSATADQTGTEVRDALEGLGDTDRHFVLTDPQAGEFKVISVERDSSGKLNVKYDDVAV